MVGRASKLKREVDDIRKDYNKSQNWIVELKFAFKKKSNSLPLHTHNLIS